MPTAVVRSALLRLLNYDYWYTSKEKKGGLLNWRIDCESKQSACRGLIRISLILFALFSRTAVGAIIGKGGEVSQIMQDNWKHRMMNI